MGICGAVALLKWRATLYAPIASIDPSVHFIADLVRFSTQFGAELQWHSRQADGSELPGEQQFSDSELRPPARPGHAAAALSGRRQWWQWRWRRWRLGCGGWAARDVMLQESRVSDPSSSSSSSSPFPSEGCSQCLAASCIEEGGYSLGT